MKNKTLPLIIAAVIIIAGAVYFMGSGDKSAKKMDFKSIPFQVGN